MPALRTGTWSLTIVYPQIVCPELAFVVSCVYSVLLRPFQMSGPLYLCCLVTHVHDFLAHSAHANCVSTHITGASFLSDYRYCVRVNIYVYTVNFRVIQLSYKQFSCKKILYDAPPTKIQRHNVQLRITQANFFSYYWYCVRVHARRGWPRHARLVLHCCLHHQGSVEGQPLTASKCEHLPFPLKWLHCHGQLCLLNIYGSGNFV